MLGVAGFSYYTISNLTEPNLPIYKPYEYLRRRTRDDGGFPWGRESLFFNPHVNVSESQIKGQESVENQNEGNAKQ